jgi:hypothetical protein
MTTPVFAADDDDDEEWEDEEDEAPKKSSKKAAPPAKKVTKPSGAPSRMGLAVSFGGASNAISFVYDLGSGLELGLGLGLNRVQYAEIEGQDVRDPSQTILIIPSFSYNLGKGLLDYGLGVDVGLKVEPDEGGNTINGFPYFYAKAELVQNLVLKISAGVNVYKPSADLNSEYNMVIDLRAQGAVVFYFL